MELVIQPGFQQLAFGKSGDTNSTIINSDTRRITVYEGQISKGVILDQLRFEDIAYIDYYVQQSRMDHGLGINGVQVNSESSLSRIELATHDEKRILVAVYKYHENNESYLAPPNQFSFSTGNQDTPVQTLDMLQSILGVPIGKKSVNDTRTRRCPACNQKIVDHAERCLYCGEQLAKT
ncbi:hypothetical protein [Cerasicoccus arenae]|uniref:Uncharacterized protein n=1 Tax=Cerasicoccus arenae TaxID=424488 RepID=A0A8J3DAJ0_9BACT|nr:hypothetical protein [Cerasicoccus arenae]MBK1857988.1 hypothetical protein [Cerasicoccus arenae]GHB97631.1 hypothetical protein GCM10007047_11850 [Cerasicoccus arenae]